MFKASLAVNPWDLADEDLHQVIDRMAGEIGVAGLAIWLAPPPLVQFRVRDIKPRIVHWPGSLCFRPQDSLYAATRCKPHVSANLKGADSLSAIAQACKERGLILDGLISASRCGQLAHKSPAVACKNVFGAVSEQSACLANPDVQALLEAMVADLSSRQVLEAIMLREFQISWSDVFSENWQLPRPLTRCEQELFSICFCESCIQRASAGGVDIEAARRATGNHLDRGLAHVRGGPTLDASLAETPPLRALFEWREKELGALLLKLRSRCSCKIWVDVDGESARSTVQIPVVDEVDPFIYCLETEEGLANLTADHPVKIVRLTASAVALSSSAELVSLFTQLVSSGVTYVVIDNYGLLSDSALTALKQAIRFARRSS